MSAKWLRMGFEAMPAPTKDVLWIEVTAILKYRMALTTRPLQLCIQLFTNPVVKSLRSYQSNMMRTVWFKFSLVFCPFK